MPVSSRPTSPHFNYDYTSELVDGIHLSRAKSPLLSRPLSPISTQLSAQLSSPLASSKNLAAALPASKTRSKSSHSVRTPPPSAKRDDKANLDDNESQADSKTPRDSKGSKPRADEQTAVRKAKSHHALNEQPSSDFNGSANQVDLNDSNSNLIKMLSQNIIELTENLNLLFAEHSNELGKETDSRTKSTETLKDNDLIDKIDQLRKVSKKLQDCTAQQQQLPPAAPSSAPSAAPTAAPQNTPERTMSNGQPITQLADQLNVVEQVDLIDSLQADKMEPEFAECRTTFDDFDQVQIREQQIMQSAGQSNDDHAFDENNNQFNEENQNRKLRKSPSSASNSSNNSNRLQVDSRPPQKEESLEDEFYECANEEQKDLRKALFKGSKLNLEQLIDKAIDEQLLGQWLKLSDSLDNEDGPVQQKHSIEELKHKFATKLAIIHYKLYQKYSKSRPINAKKWRHRKLNKCNKIQSKYTLLQGLMDEDQFIQFLLDKISYFMRKIRQCKTQRKELKKSLSRPDLEPESPSRKESERKPLKQQFEFDKDSLKDEPTLDENNNEVPAKTLDEPVLDENNNELSDATSIDRLDKNSPSIERQLDRLSEVEQELKKELVKELSEEMVREVNGELLADSLLNGGGQNGALNGDDLDDELSGAKKGSFLSKYALLFLFTLIIFMILIVLFRSLSFLAPVKKCTNCARPLLDSGQQLILQPVSHQLKQQTAKYLPACDHRIILEAQKLLGPK